MSIAPFDVLDQLGLNLHAVLAVDTLPAALRRPLPRKPDGEHWAQLILIGHAGPTLWRTIEADPADPEHPIDVFTIRAVDAWLARLTDAPIHRLYPGDAPVGLQSLGTLVGWHRPSPFKVGIHPAWGTWFAYRAAVLADTTLALTEPVENRAPCATCDGRPCLAACPAEAMSGEHFDLDRCLTHRLTDDSSCAETCLARLACPVGTEHRYPEAQIRHGYRQSLAMIRQMRRPGEEA